MMMTLMVGTMTSALTPPPSLHPWSLTFHPMARAILSWLKPSGNGSFATTQHTTRSQPPTLLTAIWALWLEVMGLVIGGVVGALGDTYRTTRNCHLGKEIKAIFIPLLNSEEDTDGDLTDLKNPGGFLRSDSFSNGQFRDLTSSVYLRASSDGQEVHIPGWPQGAEHQTQFIKDNYYVVTPYFPLVAPKNAPDQVEDRVLLAASTGFYVLLNVEHVRFPLTLSFGGQLVLGGTPVFTLDITYNIFDDLVPAGPGHASRRGGY